MQRIILLFMLGFLQTAFAEVDFSYSKYPYGTHQPFLYAVAQKTTGPILECGCGYGSTPLLHELCKKTGRILITLEDDLAWLNKFKAQYLGDGYSEDNSGWHKMFFVPGGKKQGGNESPENWIKFFKSFEYITSLNFDICFVDQTSWFTRHETVKLMKNRAKYVVVHDCDAFPNAGIFGTTLQPIDLENSIPGEFDFSDLFKHFKTYFPEHPWPYVTGPPTLVGSNFTSDLP